MQEIKTLARQLYLKLPWWKRMQFRVYMKNNNWDVKDIYTRCVREAKWIIEEESKFNF